MTLSPRSVIISLHFVFNEFQFSCRVCLKASFTSCRLRAAARRATFWVALVPRRDYGRCIHINTHTYIYAADALTCGYAHTSTVKPRFTHARVHYARYIERAFLFDTITRSTPRSSISAVIPRRYSCMHSETRKPFSREIYAVTRQKMSSLLSYYFLMMNVLARVWR